MFTLQNKSRPLSADNGPGLFLAGKKEDLPFSLFLRKIPLKGGLQYLPDGVLLEYFRNLDLIMGSWFLKSKRF